MSELTTHTSSRFYTHEGLQIAQAIADPSVTLIEVGDSFGFLLSESAYDTAIDDRLILENVLWVRLPEEGILRKIFSTRELLSRPFDDVSLYRHDTGLFVAKDIESDLYFPSPSHDPYYVIFITLEQYRMLSREIEEAAMQRLLDSIKGITKTIPDIAFDGESLFAQPGYARADAHALDGDLLEMER